MNDEQARRVGHNEALFRQVNERIEDVNDTFGGITGEFLVVCECGNIECTEQIAVSREVYERTRQHSARFIIKHGHEIPEVEHPVVEEDDYVIIEKDVPGARNYAERTDPRS